MKITGSVTDLKGNPLEGVPVSDGQSITLTDQEGRFAMDTWEKAHLVFLNLLTMDHDDWYFPLKESQRDYHFQCTPAPQTEDFCFLHTSDTEIEGCHDFGWMDFVKSACQAQRPAFFVNTGDLCRLDGMRRHHLIMNSQILGCPTRFVIGNHDFSGEDYGESVFEKYYGPVWYSFDCGKIHFLATSYGKGENPSGYTMDDQIRWIQKDLALKDPEKRVIVLCHSHCPDEKELVLRGETLSVNFRENGILAWVFGHLHSNFLTEDRGVYTVCSNRADSGGVDSSPAAVRKLSLTGGKFSSEMLFNSPAAPKADPCEWETALEGRVLFSTPRLSEERLFVATFDDGFPKRCGVYCLNAENGEILWQFATQGAVKSDFGMDETCIYPQDDHGNIYCLRKADGRLLWHRRNQYQKANHLCTDTLVIGDVLTAGNHKTVYLYDKRNGNELWSDCFFERSSDNSGAKLVFDAKRNRLLLSAQWRYLASLELESKTLAWSIREGALWFRSATPLVLGDAIYSAGNRALVKVDAATGEILKETRPGGVYDVSGAPVYDNGILYYPTASHGVIAVDPETLEQIREYPCDSALLLTCPYLMHGCTVEGSPVIDGERLLFAGSDGNLWIYRKKDAALLKKHALGAPCTVSPVVEGDRAYLCDFDGKVKMLRV